MNNRLNLVLASITSALCLFALSLLPGCGTPAQNLATGNYLAGNFYATYELGKNPASLPGLEHLVTALPLIPMGKVSAREMGQLNAELALAKAAAPDSQTANQVGSLISAVSQASAAANGGNPTINTAVISAALTDAANGIRHGIDFWQGQQDVKNKPPGS